MCLLCEVYKSEDLEEPTPITNSDIKGLGMDFSPFSSETLEIIEKSESRKIGSLELLPDNTPV